MTINTAVNDLAEHIGNEMKILDATVEDAATRAENAASASEASATGAQAAAADAQGAAADAQLAADQAEATLGLSKNQKHLLSADWQPRPDAESPGEANRLRAVMDSIAARHPDLTHAHVLGDLIDEATHHTTGAAPEYGYPEFFADWRTRLPVPLANAFFLPGNHDRDGTGIGNFEEAWSMQTYRSWVGPEYYYTLQGNLLMIYAGDQGGSTGGVITDSVVEWIGTVMRTNKDKNIILCLHHPLSGTYQGQTQATHPTSVQTNSSRITNILDEVAADANNVVAVFYGHVGSAHQFNDETWHGTRHIQIGMHIPSNVNDGTKNDQYYVMELTHGASTFDVVQWDATADTQLATKSITWAYPLQLDNSFTFDGRKQSDADAPKVRPMEIMLPMDEHRRNNGGTWEVDNTEPHWALTLGAEDRSADDWVTEYSLGLRVKFPGADLGSKTYDEMAVDGVAVDDIGILFHRGGGSQEAPDINVRFRTANDGVVYETNEFSPNGLHVGHYKSDSINPGNDAVVGCTVNKDGFLSAHRASGLAGYFGRAGNGDLVEFNNGTSRAGVISISGTTTTYGTSSDGRLKEDFKDFDGLALIELLKVYDYAWRSTGDRAKGVVAQEAYEVAPYAVTQGDSPDDTWSVDYSKFVPDLIRAVQQLSTKVDELERQLTVTKKWIEKT